MTLPANGHLTVEYISKCLSAKLLKIDLSAFSPTVLATSSGATQLKASPFRKDTCSNLVCSNKVYCGKTGHLLKTCIKPGGGMAGKTVEEAKAAKKLLREQKAGQAGRGSSLGFSAKNSTFLTLKDTSGCTCYAVDGHLFYPSAAPVSALVPATNTFPQIFLATTSQAPAILSGLSDLSSDNVASLLSPSNGLKLHTYIVVVDDPHASIDWSQYCHTVHFTNIAVQPGAVNG